MSQENVELHRRGLKAFNERDVEALIAITHPDAELYSAMVDGTYRGHAGARKWHRDFEETLGTIRAELEALFDLGDTTLAFTILRAHGQQSGADVVMKSAQVCKWRDGLCVYMRAYARREEALRNLGIAEDELEPVAP